MPTRTESGHIPLRDGSAIAWVRRELAPREGRAFRFEAQLRAYRVTTVAQRADGSAVVATYDVPGTHLHAFLVGELYDREGGPGEGHAVLTVERLPEPGEVEDGPPRRGT